MKHQNGVNRWSSGNIYILCANKLDIITAWKTFCKYVETVSPPPPLFPLPFPSLPLEVGPLITGSGSQED